MSTNHKIYCRQRSKDKMFNVFFKNFSKTLFILLITFLSFNNPVCAAVKENKELSLYEVLLPVTNFNKDEKNKVMREGFKNVVVQVSGSEKALSNHSIQKAMNAAEDYVSRYFIQEDADNNRFVRIKFDSTQINSLLQQTNQPILSKKPSTSIWFMLSRENGQTYWLGEESEPELFQQLQSFAKQRKVPLLFPLLDLAESELIADKSILNGELSPLEEASERYNAEMVWFGKITQQKSGWYGQWTLLSQGDVEQWDGSHAELSALCKEAMDELTKRSASIHLNAHNTMADARVVKRMNTASNTNSDTLSKLRISVSGINGIEEYSKVLEYLKSLPTVKEVEVAQVKPNQTLFELSSTGNQKGVAESISKGKILVEEKMAVFPEKNLDEQKNSSYTNNTLDTLQDKKLLKVEIRAQGTDTVPLQNESITQENESVSPDKDILTYKLAEVF